MTTFTFANTAGINIGDKATISQSLTVYGLTGTITGLAANLTGLTHSAAGNLDMLLVGPDNVHNLEFWSDAGDTFDLAGNYVLSDSGANALPSGSSPGLVAGTYKPADYGTIETNADFGSTVGTINHAATNGSGTFASSFNGIFGNGVWKYYVHDDTAGDVGHLNAWGLSLSTDRFDLRVLGTNGKDVIKLDTSGNDGSYSVNNLGTVTFTDGMNFYVSGDSDGGGTVVLAGHSIVAGDDTITSRTDTDGTSAGDIDEVAAGGSLKGGNDVITHSGGNVTGDSFVVAGTLIGGDDIITVKAGSYSGKIFGDADVVSGTLQGGGDTIHGSIGNDYIWGDWRTLQAGAQATGGNDFLYGEEGIDTIYGNGGDDYIDGGTDGDRMIGGTGNDIYVVDDANDEIYESSDAAGGIDEVRSARAYIDLNEGFLIHGQVENATMTGSANGDIQGNDLNNVLKGNDGRNNIYGGKGLDEIHAGLGDDKMMVYNMAEFVAGETYDGGEGIDTLSLQHYGSSSLFDLRTVTINSIEKMEFYGVGQNQSTTAQLNSSQIGPGLSASAKITGNSTADVSNIIQVTLDTSTVDLSKLSLVYFDNPLDEIQIYGNAISTGVNIIGTNVHDFINGGNGADTLTGGLGADRMAGGKGSDTYRVDNAGDIVAEGKDEGTADVVLASTSYMLGKGVYVEFLQTNSTAGTAAINLVGNELSQTIVGNAGINSLSDGGGAGDVLKGLGGNDIYRVASAATTIIEGKSEGTADVVLASTSYTLGKGVYVEFLQTNSTAGTTAINLVGNELSQTIVGNAGINTLTDGGGAGDVLKGLGGNDIYRVASAATTIIEGKSEGTADIVLASVSFKLNAGAYIEFLQTNSSAGTSAINLTGNELAQTLVGNAGANRLDGKGGADTLTGRDGKDTFVFSSALNLGVDTITDFKAVDDTIELSKSIFTALSLGTLSTSAFRANTTGLAGDASDRIIYETDTGKLFYDADGTGTGASGIHFATLTGHPTITNADFVVVA